MGVGWSFNINAETHFIPTDYSKSYLDCCSKKTPDDDLTLGKYCFLYEYHNCDFIYIYIFFKAYKEQTNYIIVWMYTLIL